MTQISPQAFLLHIEDPEAKIIWIRHIIDLQLTVSGYVVYHFVVSLLFPIA